MKLLGGKVVVDVETNHMIEELAGVRVPDEGLPPMELRVLLTEALARQRAENPFDEHFWDCLENVLITRALDRLGEPELPDELDGYEGLDETLRDIERVAVLH